MTVHEVNDVETYSDRGQWVSRVVGRDELSRSYSSREEAVEQGAAIAERLGGTHYIVDSPPSGDITDPDDHARPSAELGDEGQGDLAPEDL